MPPSASTEPDPALGRALLTLARAAIERRLAESGVAPIFLQPKKVPVGQLPPLSDLSQATRAALESPGASFVTLTRDGHLRGCIGSLEAHRPLRQDVESNAVAAAFRDPRFSPLTADEWPTVQIEVSRLSAPEALVATDEKALFAQLRPGIDGLILEAGFRRATFLPQVWEQLPEPSEFLAELQRKAGLPAGRWSPEMRFARYQVQKWKEPPTR